MIKNKKIFFFLGIALTGNVLFVFNNYENSFFEKLKQEASF